mmetsp:Transcript_65164/g.210102  ORF Transcript_65164/g.210102 Transcript_65164/m.210102 type:complete len:230 (-) Transcript_65164:877-1566(-)
MHTSSRGPRLRRVGHLRQCTAQRCAMPAGVHGSELLCPKGCRHAHGWMVLDDLEHLPRVVLRVGLHRGGLTGGLTSSLTGALDGGEALLVSREGVGQVQYRATLAAINDARQQHALLQRRHQEAVHLVVEDHACRAEIDWAECLITTPAGVFVLTLADVRATVAAVEEEEGITRACAFHEPRHASLDGSLLGAIVLAIIHEHPHVKLIESLPQEVLADTSDVRVAHRHL